MFCKIIDLIFGAVLLSLFISAFILAGVGCSYSHQISVSATSSKKNYDEVFVKDVEIKTGLADHVVLVEITLEDNSKVWYKCVSTNITVLKFKTGMINKIYHDNRFISSILYDE